VSLVLIFHKVNDELLLMHKALVFYCFVRFVLALCPFVWVTVVVSVLCGLSLTVLTLCSVRFASTITILTQRNVRFARLLQYLHSVTLDSPDYYNTYNT